MQDFKMPSVWSNDRPKAVLLGDSVLDNFYWLEDPRSDLQAVLSRLSPQIQWINLAVDESTTSNLKRRATSSFRRYEIARRKVWNRSSEEPEEAVKAGYPVASDGVVYPLEILRRLRNVRHVILSVGGNDVYLNRDIQLRLLKSLRPRFWHLREQVAAELRGRYQELLKDIVAAAPDASVIPVIVYHPHYRFNLLEYRGWGANVLNLCQRLLLSRIVTPLVRALLNAAGDHNVVDLSRTFNPADERLYGTGRRQDARWSGCEPSNLSNHIMARLIVHACQSKQQRSLIWAVVNELTGQPERFCEATRTPELLANYTFGPL